LASIAVVDLVCAPNGLDVGVSEPVIHDPVSPPDAGAGAVVLGVGVVGTSEDAVELIARAGEAGAVAVALKLEGSAPPSLHDAAEHAGVAVLAVPSEMTWSQAHSLIRTAVGSVSPPDRTGDVPLGDLFALANSLAAMTGGAVEIEDRQTRVLAYSTQQGVDEPRRQTILGRQVPEEWVSRLEEAGVFKRLWAGEVVRYEAPEGFDLQPRLAVAVRAGDVILGSIWVAEGDEPLRAEAEDVLRETARIAALHLVRHRAAEDLERSARGELLISVLEGRGGVEATAYRLGVTATGAFAVLAFEPHGTDEVEDALARERVLDLVTLYGEAFRNRSAAVRLGRTIYVLLPGPDPDRPQRLVELSLDIVARARESLGVGLRAGVGSIVGHLRDVPRSRLEADQVLRALGADPTGPVAADFAGAHGRVTLMELRDFAADRPHLRSRRIEQLSSHDDKHGTCYVETLRCYLDAFGDIPRAAKVASVHPNTFRYRLRRLVEVSGMDLDDPEERLLASLELRLGPDAAES
jgi:DNA-binding PucR family transcriptional regulator